MTIGTLDRIAASIGASFVVDIRYQGGLGDRLVDAVHAALVEIVVGVLRRYKWEVEVEFTFNVSAIEDPWTSSVGTPRPGHC